QNPGDATPPGPYPRVDRVGHEASRVSRSKAQNPRASTFRTWGTSLVGGSRVSSSQHLSLLEQVSGGFEPACTTSRATHAAPELAGQAGEARSTGFAFAMA